MIRYYILAKKKKKKFAKDHVDKPVGKMFSGRMRPH